MCIICFKPFGIPMPTREILETCFYSNPDGAGFAVWRDSGTSIYYRKGFFDFESFYDSVIAEKITKDDCAAFHFRIATNGALEEKNCHPFFVSSEKDCAFSTEGYCKSLIFHNGILSSKYSYDKKTSDTYLFTLALAKQEKKLLAQKSVEKFIQDETKGSQILYLHAGEDVTVASGDWLHDKETGCYFSNSSFKNNYHYYFDDFEPSKYAKTVPSVLKCPGCGEDIHIRKISDIWDIYECGTCSDLFDSSGEEVELYFTGKKWTF